MSTETRARVEVDPYRYGWRYVRRELPDGREEFDTVPLTPDDLLFPQEYDHAMQTREHNELLFYLHPIFQDRLRGVPGALLLGDHRVDYDVPGVRPVGPDLAVFLDVVDLTSKATFEVAAHHARPALVVEITSTNTRDNDFGIKKDIYHRAGVAQYAIIDLPHENKRRPVALYGFRDTPEGYEPIPPDDSGRLRLESLGLWLAIDRGRVICIDGETGEPIGDYSDQAQARRAEHARAEAEKARAEAEHARAEAESARAEAEKARADVEVKARQAEAEARQAEIRARLDVEAKLRAMEEEIGKLRGG